MYLCPGIRQYIDLATKAYDDEAEFGTVEQQRAAYLAFAARFNTPHPAGVTASDRSIPGPGGTVAVRVYRPSSNPASNPASNKALPCVIYYHGGGFVLGNCDSHDGITADIAARTGAVVVSVDYRLAPEHPYPAPFEDSYAALRAVAGEAAAFGIDRGRIVLSGDSAGGNLAAAVALAARDRGGPALAGQALIYPGLGADFDTPSAHEMAEAPMLTRQACIEYWDIYLGRGKATPDCYAAPLLAASVAGLPPAFITTAHNDPLRDDGLLYADRLRGAGVAAELSDAPGLVHGWLRARHLSPEAGIEFDKLCRAIRAFFG